MKIRNVLTYSDKGDRPHQEDFVLNHDEKGIFTVSDGFGGALAGKEAAQSACEATVQFLKKGAGDEDATLPFVIRNYYSLVANVLFNAVIHGNHAVLQQNEKRNVNEKGGCSTIAGYFDEDFLALANVGSTSAWLLRQGQLTELARPRTLARIRDPFSPDPIPGEDVPMMSLGMSEDLEPEIAECRVQPGDWVLLQSDGLTEAARRQLAAFQSEDAAPERVMEYLRGQSFEDNLSLSLVIL